MASSDELPDLVLLRIFAYLTLEDQVFMVPRVCRRWEALLPEVFLAQECLYVGHRPCVSAVEAALRLTGPQLRHARIGNRAKDLREVLDLIAQHCPQLVRLEFNVWRPVGNEVVARVAAGCPNLRYLDVQYQMYERIGVPDTTFQALPEFRSLNVLIVRGNGRSMDALLARTARANALLQYVDVLHEVTLTNDAVSHVVAALRGVLVGLHFHCPHLSRVVLGDVLSCSRLVSLTVASKYEVFADLLEPRIRSLTRLKALRILEPSSTLSIARSSFGRGIIPDLLWHGTFRGLTHLTLSSAVVKDENLMLVFDSCPGLVGFDAENPKRAVTLSATTFRRLAVNSGGSLASLSLQVLDGDYDAWAGLLDRNNFPLLKHVYLAVTNGVSIATWQQVDARMHPVAMVVNETVPLAIGGRVTYLFHPFQMTVFGLTPIFRSRACDRTTDAAFYEMHNHPVPIRRLPDLREALEAAFA